MKEKTAYQKIAETYYDFMDTYAPSPYVNTEWPMEHGIYKQYSAFKDDVKSTAGTFDSIVVR